MMWGKIVELLIEWMRDKPARDVVDDVLVLRDAMQACEDAYRAYSRAREDGLETDELYNMWRLNFAALDLAVAQVDEVMQIFGPDARRYVEGYLVSEMVPSPEEGVAVAAAAYRSGQPIPLRLRETTAEVEFHEARDELDAFIRQVYSPEKIAAARARLRGSAFARG